MDGVLRVAAHPHWHPSGCTVRSDCFCVHLEAPHNLYLWQLSAVWDHYTNTLLLRDIQVGVHHL